MKYASIDNSGPYLSSAPIGQISPLFMLEGLAAVHRYSLPGHPATGVGS